TATDPSGESASCEAVVTVADDTPPVIGAASASPDMLWPPNHRMVRVTASVQASDNCGGQVSSRIAAVSVNEPADGAGDGQTAPDWDLGGGLDADLRAERSGRGDGRVYTLSVESSDSSGNSAHAEATVTVPHDKGKRGR
ncbi:MAG: hemolysin, partial [Elusimicrobiota bacterium]